ncbi:MAG: ABC transporter ATP-binding protein/permease [Butyrivibrio sp.]|uniref:ABC transporter ATP-binding protein n=1 Tax=Butyrivibrio sp. TaxID=28121 RepID=UPI0025E1B064|nr:ABC transporter ATP-binding protein [Butyrivibrio sp.]MCR5771847.1 ABC transporter ATP-binding protein/permease [Butyrivibrio sp.]
MIHMVHRLLKFCDRKNARSIRFAYIFSFLKSFTQNAPVIVAILVIRDLMNGTASVKTCVISSGILFLFLILTALFGHMSDRLQSSSGYKVFADKRIEFARHLRKLPMGYFTAGNIGRISSILSEDMVFVEENSMSIIAEVVSGFFSQLVVTMFLFTLNPILGLIMLITSIIVMCVAYPMNRESMRNSDARQKAVEDLSGAVIEYAESMAVSKSFGIMGESSTHLRNSFANSREANLTFEKEHTPWERALEIIYSIGTALVLATTIFLYQKDIIDNVSFIGVMLFLMNLFTPFKQIYQLGSRLTIMNIALNRIESVFAQKPIPEDKSASPLKKYKHEIEYNNVSFSYENEKVLHGVSFTADQNEMVALVGESGSGKTTIANLLARFWDIDSGRICVRGTDIKTMSLGTLMDHISVVFQKVYLFEDTIFNNIAMGKDGATYEEVVEAAKKARCYDFIMQLPYGFDTRVGEGGSTLSGGEAQRISIARCILKDAPIIILDEATASIDADNERYIKEAMSELCKNKTTLVIAHRLNTIQGADKIIVMDHGRIAEQGTHSQLIASKGAYYRMYKLQKSMNENTKEISA